MRLPNVEDVTAILAITFGGMISTGLTAALLLWEVPAHRTPPAQGVPVVVAARDLKTRTVLTAADVKVVEWPGDAAPAGFATSVASVVGLEVRRSVARHEPIRPYEMAVRIGTLRVHVSEPGDRKQIRR